MPTYQAEVETEKNYAGNVVIKLAGVYFAVRQPDSGLVIPYPFSHSVQSLVINATTINPKQVSSTISSNSFILLDKSGVVSAMVKDRGAGIIKEDVEIWLGRSNVGMAFSDYKKLPVNRVSKVGKPSGAGAYNFTTRDTTERINVAIYSLAVLLDGDISPGTTIIKSQSAITDFPSAGKFRIGREIISYSYKSDILKTFYGCSRGEFLTTPVEHAHGDTLGLADSLTANPIDILLQLLTSGSGAGDYDLLSSGLAMGQALIDVSGIEAIRDTFFPDDQFSLALYSNTSALKYIEKEILAPCNLRFIALNDKLSLALVDSAQFIEEAQVLDHDTILPNSISSDIQDSDVQNKVTIEYDFDEQDSKFRSKFELEDAGSIATYGASSSPLSFLFKGVQDAAFVENFAQALLDRYAQPSPQISVRTQMDKSLLNVADKVTLETSRLPNEYGELVFADSLEVVSKAINWQNGEVTLKLAYTSLTGTRLGYIAPSDPVDTITSQSVIEVAAGRGDFWRAGWKVRLWDSILKAHTSDATNEIASIDGDEITFVDAWSTTLLTDHVLVFPDFDEATASQRRYAFVGVTGNNFSRREKVYSIVP